MYVPMPMQLKPHKEYDLEVQAILDANIGDCQERYRRAVWLTQLLTICHLGDVVISKERQFKQLVCREFGSVPVIQTHGIRSTGQLWTSVEFDEVVVGINRGFTVGIDELGSIYGMHGYRVGIDVITTPFGVMMQNTNQLTTPKWFDNVTKIGEELGLPYTPRPVKAV